MLIQPFQKQHGLSLIEIMVALTISMILLLSISTFFLDSLRSIQNRQAEAQLNSQLSTAIQLIEQDTKRAGFSPTLGDTTVSGIFTEVTLQCVLYDYYTSANLATAQIRQTGFKRGLDGNLLIYNPSLLAVAGYVRPTTAARTTLCGACQTSTNTGQCNNWFPVTDYTKLNIDFADFTAIPPAGNIDQRLIRFNIVANSVKDPLVKRKSTIIITSSNGS